MDIVGCTKLPTDEQKRIVGRLQELVRESKEFQQSRESDQLISLPTGDGMALAFFNQVETALRCAIEITNSIQAESLCKIRMGLHSGPVFVMEDINGTRNISGAGINRAERVMSCGGQGHILLSDTAAESLRHLSEWQGKIHELGECQAKDGWVRVWNFVDGTVGNAAVPAKSKRRVYRRRVVLGAVLAIVGMAVAAGGAAVFRWNATNWQVPDKSSVAVLPFADMSSERNQEYFSDGLAEELLNSLSKTPGLRVPGRVSSFQFKNSEDFRLIGGKLNVANILTGSVRRQGTRVRIAVQLVRTDDGMQWWSDMFDRELTDIFAAQEQIARAVAGALKVALLGEKNEAPSPQRNPNGNAYNAYLQGRYFFKRGDSESLSKAYRYFEQAIAFDPRYAAAWVALGETRMAQAGWGHVPREQGYQEARSAVQQALASDASLGEAHSALAEIKMLQDWDWAGAEASYQKALSLSPQNTRAINRAAELARIRGRWDESIRLYRRAIDLDPLDSFGHLNIGIAFYYAGRQEDAIGAFQKAIALTPEIEVACEYLGRAYLAQSRLQEALSQMKKERNSAFRLFGLALAYHATGRKHEADASLAELVKTYPMDGPYQIAEVYAFRGEAERALHWLEQAYARHDAGMTEIKGDPLFKSLEHEKRYVALLQKLRLAP